MQDFCFKIMPSHFECKEGSSSFMLETWKIVNVLNSWGIQGKLRASLKYKQNVFHLKYSLWNVQLVIQIYFWTEKQEIPFIRINSPLQLSAFRLLCYSGSTVQGETVTEWHPEFIAKLCQQGDNSRQKLKFIHTVDDPQQGQISQALTENQTSTDVSGTELTVQATPQWTQQCLLAAQGRAKKRMQSPCASDWISLQSISGGAAPLAMRINTQLSILELLYSKILPSKSKQHKYKQGKQIFSLVLLHGRAR